MKKTALMKTVVREIFGSKARFFSIFLIILLGVSFFAGLEATGPDMKQTANLYFDKQALMDQKLQSSLGFTQADLQLVQKTSGVKIAEASYWQDVLADDENHVLRLFAYQPKQKLNKYVVESGRLPEKSGEIALDNSEKIHELFKIGDTLSLPNTNEKGALDSFQVSTFKVVGFVNSPLYIEKFNRDHSLIGKGALDGFGVVWSKDLSLDYIPTIYIQYSDGRGQGTYSNAYKKAIQTGENNVKTALKEQPKKRLQDMQKEASQQIATGEKDLADARKALKQGAAKIAKAQKDYEVGEKNYVAGKKTYEEKITISTAQLNAQKAKLNTAQQQLNSGAAKLAEAKVAYGDALRLFQSETKDLKELEATADQLNEWINLTEAEFTKEASQITGMMMAISESLKTAGINVPAVSQPVSKAELFPVKKVLDNLIKEAQQKSAAGQKKLDAARIKIAAEEKKITAGKIKIQQGTSQIATANKQLADAKAQGQAELTKSRKALDAGKVSLEKAKKKYATEKQKAEKKLAQGEKQLRQARQTAAELTAPEYYYADRFSDSNFSEYEENANRIANIANVFPVFFFLIAALVTLSTMARMVDEKRQEIGTLKALGYTNHEVSLKYLIYAAAAGLSGALLGLAGGNIVFPKVIYDAYGILYNLPDLHTQWYTVYTTISLGVALVCTVGAAWVVLRIEVRDVPANLMQPRAPKAGKRILLEKITPLWQRLNFFQKVTARNLFRYKQRMFMTIFGIAGCMALIITGFGLKDSISDIVKIQFDKLWHYQASVTLSNEITDQERKTYETALTQMPDYKGHMSLASYTYDYPKKGVTTQSVNVHVVQDPKQIEEYVLFNDRKSGKKYHLSDSGAIINEKLAKLYHLQEGDTITLKDAHEHRYKLKVAHITENYATHFAFVTPAYYQKTFKEAPVYNVDYLKLTTEPASETDFAEKLMSYAGVVNVSFLSEISDSMDDTLSSLNIIVWVLIVAAALLAFIVLYNLTNINISERVRELSTIKVLGFYDGEVTSYIYRENTILTIFGILVGAFFGKYLHHFVLNAAEVDMVMFVPDLHLDSYLYSGCLTLFFSLAVMLVMHRKLKKINMIEALKSNE